MPNTFWDYLQLAAWIKDVIKNLKKPVNIILSKPNYC